MANDPQTNQPEQKDSTAVMLIALGVIVVIAVFAWGVAPKQGEIAVQVMNTVKLTSTIVGILTAAIGIAKTLQSALSGGSLADAGAGGLLGLIGAVLVVAGSLCFC